MRMATSPAAHRNRLRRRAAASAAALACLLLQGCGNLYEHVSEGAWREVGANAPASSSADLAVSLLTRGAGSEVHAGDLVYARIRVLRPSAGRSPAEPEVFNAWIWSGRSPRDDVGTADIATWAELGSQELRATVLGKSVGDRYSVTLERNAQKHTLRLPLYGLADQDSVEPRDHKSLWPVLDTRGHPTEIEILDACPGRLLRRTAELRQWGPVMRFFDSYYPTSRRGTLGWTALEGDCGEPHGKVRFELGPMYLEQHMLLDWSSSYRRTHFKDSWLGLAVRVLIAAAASAVTFSLARFPRPAAEASERR